MTEIHDAIASMETRIERRLVVGLEQQNKTLDRIERQVTLTNGRVTVLEEERIRQLAATAARAEAVKEAAELVASKAAIVLAKKDRSNKRKALYVSGAAALVGSLGTIATVVGQYLYHM